MAPVITVFTPTYNRAHTLPRLYESLLLQDDSNAFEWLIIDDNSDDNTKALVNDWIKEGNISIRYIRLNKNGGKPRAINIAVNAALSEFLFIVDSDDYLLPGIIPKLIAATSDIADDPEINGVGVLRQSPGGSCFAKPRFETYMDATNLQREEYGLNVDCNEAYKISVLKKYPFRVWDGETFTPESTILDAMALDGYKIRWLNEPGVISEYQEDGLTKGSWNLQKRNPMGYAMLYDSKLRYINGVKARMNAAIQMTAQCCLGRNLKYIFKSNAPGLALLLLPASFIIYLRRLWQYRSV